MKSFIRNISLVILLSIFLFGLSIKYVDYNKQQLELIIKKGKYTYDKNFTFQLNDSLIKNKTIKEYQSLLFDIIQINKKTDLQIDHINKKIRLKNKTIVMAISYELQDSLVFKAVHININNLNYCED